MASRRKRRNKMCVRSSSFAGQSDPFAFALGRNHDAVDAVKLLGLTKDPVPEYVVDVTPKRDFEQRRYYDARTYLLSRVEVTDYGGHETTWIYKSYSTAIGSPFPNAIDEERDGVVTLRSSVVTFERVAIETLDLSIPASRALFDLSGRDAVEIPARFTDEGIIVPIAIEGRGLDLYLDSGASVSLLDRSVVHELAMSVSGDDRVRVGGDYAGANVPCAQSLDRRVVCKGGRLYNCRFPRTLARPAGPWDRRLARLRLYCQRPLRGELRAKLTLFRTLPVGLQARGGRLSP